MAHAKQRSSGSAERPSLDNFPTDLSGASKDDLLERLAPLRRGLHPAAVHRHPGHQQERRGAPQPVRQGARRRDHVRRLLDRGLRADRGVGHAAQARPAHLPDPAVRRRGRPGRPAAVRHLHPGRAAVRRLPPDHAQAPARAGQEARLRDDGGVRGGVLSVRAGARRLAHHDHPRFGRLLRPGPAGQGRGDPAGHRRAAGGDGVRGRGGAPRGGRRAARDRLQVRRRAGHRGQPHHLQVHRPERRQPLRLHRLVHAQADPGHQRQRHAHAPVAVPGQGQRLLRSQGRVPALQGRR